MDTTQTEALAISSSSNGPGVASRGGPWWLALAGLLPSAATFLFGGFLVVLVIPFLFPPLRRWRAFAYGLFAGVVLVRVLMGLGVNPVVSWAQARVIERIESSLGGEVTYDNADGDPLNGWLRFEGVRVAIPDLNGSVQITQLTVNAGAFMLHRPDGVSVTGRGFTVVVDAGNDRLEDWLSSREKHDGEPVSLDLEEGVLEVRGGVGAVFAVPHLAGRAALDGWALHVAMSQAAITVKERTHTLDVFGGVSVGDTGDGFRVDVDLRAVEPELGHGVMRGSLRPGSDTFVACTIDELNLKPLWARYRVMDEYDGVAYGHVKISGELGRLVLDFDLGISDYSYYHTTAMGLERENSFILPGAELAGRTVLIDGREIEFENVTLLAPEATLATGKQMNARGSGLVVLNGRYPKLSGRLEAIVESGEINQGVTWATEQRESLQDVTPNLVLVGEQFPHLDLAWEVEVRELTLKTAPLSGSVSGKLEGTFYKEEGARVGKLRAGGELVLGDGKVDCLGLQGDMTGRLIFNPSAPPRHATLRGQITGSVGETPVDCEVTGEISHPGFIFKSMTMSPEALGRKIYRYSAHALTPGEELARRSECVRIFGAYAAGQQNPFEARNMGKVSFGFK
ncbi:MAG: hypothetical protein K8I27_17295 [Planctomycetes bacterium]|nr:hypothetical protein [Planctomycetota bacterium]